jgi:hypothetical protein
MGASVYRIDTVETPFGAFYCFVHFSQAMSVSAKDILQSQQVTIPANGGWVTIGQNTSGGYNPASPDSISHIIYTANEIFCVNRSDWQAYMWSEMEESWVPSDIAIIAEYIPDMPVTTISETIINFITTIATLIPPSPAPTPITIPDCPTKKKKSKRYVKSYEEYELARQLFV